jgi:hypothetical protein
MRLRIERLGPLREAEIDLSKRLIVLAGSNDAAKRHLAWASYGLSYCANRSLSQPYLRAWVEELFQHPDHQIDLSAALARGLVDLLATFAAAYREALPKCFARGRDAFADVALTLGADEHTRSAARKLDAGSNQLLSTLPGGRDCVLLHSLGEGAPHFKLSLLDNNAVSAWREAERARGERFSRFDASKLDASAFRPLVGLDPEQRANIEREIGPVLGHCAVRSIVPSWQAIVLTERVAINRFAEELAEAARVKLGEARATELRRNHPDMSPVPRRIDAYPWPFEHAVREATVSVDWQSPFADLAEELEASILGGRVFPSDRGPTFAPVGAPELRLLANDVGPAVGALAGLALYFRHRTQAGYLLVIEEPELGLSPREQRALARLLVKAARRDCYLIVGTESDYMLRELSNLIALSRLPEGEARDLGFDPAHGLAPEDVGVYHLNEGIARPVPVDETGFSIDAPDETLSALEADERKLRGRGGEGR